MNIDVRENERTAIHTYLKRVREGVRVDVKVVDEVEEFFRYWGHDQPMQVASAGRAWKPIGSTPLVAWVVPQLDDRIITHLDLYNLGRPLQTPAGSGASQNISFLRLVGASKGDGVSFLYEDVVSRAGLELMAQNIRNATSQFYDQYIRPAHLSISVTTDIKYLE